MKNGDLTTEMWISWEYHGILFGCDKFNGLVLLEKIIGNHGFYCQI
jgi:hypothetical protein